MHISSHTIVLNSLHLFEELWNTNIWKTYPIQLFRVLFYIFNLVTTSYSLRKFSRHIKRRNCIPASFLMEWLIQNPGKRNLHILSLLQLQPFLSLFLTKPAWFVWALLIYAWDYFDGYCNLFKLAFRHLWQWEPVVSGTFLKKFAKCKSRIKFSAFDKGGFAVCASEFSPFYCCYLEEILSDFSLLP